MQVWIDQDCCTGAGLCVDHCPDLFVVLADGIGYVHDGGLVISEAEPPAMPVPAATSGPPSTPSSAARASASTSSPTRRRLDTDRDADIVDAEIVEG